MSPAAAARALAAGLVLLAALSARADDAAPARAPAAPASPALLTAGLPAHVEPASAGVAAASWSPLADARRDARSELRDLPRFEGTAAGQAVDSGDDARGSSPRLSLSGRNAGVLLGLSLKF